MSKWAKVVFLGALLAGAGYYFGTVCERMAGAYVLLLHPSIELVDLLLWLLLALLAVAVSAGLVAALVRPLWAAVCAFVPSGAAALLGWEVSAASGVLVLVYVLAAFFYVTGVASELGQRIRFSVRPISESQGVLLMALALMACGSVYLGGAAYVQREGFSIPEPYIELVMKSLEKQVEARAPIGDRQEVVAEFRQQFRATMDDFFEKTVKPYERFVPLAIALGVFMSLATITRVLSWVSTGVLSAVFPLLTALGMTKLVSETHEVTTLVLR